MSDEANRRSMNGRQNRNNSPERRWFTSAGRKADTSLSFGISYVSRSLYPCSSSCKSKLRMIAVKGRTARGVVVVRFETVYATFGRVEDALVTRQSQACHGSPLAIVAQGHWARG